jgi:hypothetical protein
MNTKLFLKLATLLLFMMVHGCFFPVFWGNPGYMVTIEIQRIAGKDAIVVEKVLRNYDFKTLSPRLSGERCVWFRKEIPTSRQIEYPFVKAAVCFEGTDGQDVVKDFRILIMNEWQGKDAQLQREIDSTADILIAELLKLVGKENIAVTRKATGPPF